MGTIPYDADPLSNSIPEEICKSLRVVAVNVVMKSRMRGASREGRTFKLVGIQSV